MLATLNVKASNPGGPAEIISVFLLPRLTFSFILTRALYCVLFLLTYYGMYSIYSFILADSEAVCREVEMLKRIRPRDLGFIELAVALGPILVALTLLQ